MITSSTPADYQDFWHNPDPLTDITSSDIMNDDYTNYEADFDYSGEWEDKSDLLASLEEETIKDNYDGETMQYINNFRWCISPRCNKIW